MCAHITFYKLPRIFPSIFGSYIKQEEADPSVTAGAFAERYSGDVSHKGYSWESVGM